MELQAAEHTPGFGRGPAPAGGGAGPALAVRPPAGTLVGCTVAPAFDFSGFESAPDGWAPG
jgi:predicted cupin superfamily sugar epimerase